MKWASVAAFAAMAVGLALLIPRRAIIAANATGMVVQAAAVLLMAWARLTFGRRSFHAAANPTEGGLVTTGPYAFLRHPIYAAVLWFAWAAVLTHLSPATGGLGLLVTAGAALRIAAEERFLVSRYPQYEAYAARTRRVIPFVF